MAPRRLPFPAIHLGILKIGLFAAVSIIAGLGIAAYLLRGGFHPFVGAPNRVAPAAD